MNLIQTSQKYNGGDSDSSFTCSVQLLTQFGLFLYDFFYFLAPVNEFKIKILLGSFSSY